VKKFVPLIITFIIGASIGTVSTFLILRSSNPQQAQRMTSSDQFQDGHTLDHLFDRAFDSDFFDQSQNPFDDMKKLRERMRQLYGDKQFDQGFDDWYGNRFGGKLGEIESREDHEFIYFEVDLKDIDQDSLKFNVQNGQMTIQGTYQRNEDGTSMSSTFMRSFPLPPGINEAAMSSEIKDEKLVIKFPKMSGETI